MEKGPSDLAKAKEGAEQTLKIALDNDAFTRLYGHTKSTLPRKERPKIAVLVIGQFGEETTKILELKYPSHRPESKDLRKPRCNEID
jgi:hypothetical protein